MIGFIAPPILKADRRNIQPFDPIAREFIAPFCENPYRWIEKLSGGGDWSTNNKYPLSPYQLWEKHQDPNCFVGVRHGNKTTYAGGDIDINSPYHPNQDETAIARIKAALESIGIVRSLNVRSSNSGGLHIYFPLPENVNTFKLSCAIASALLANGFKIEKGKLEIFPNVRAYDSQYNGLRLPLQQGGAIVDDDGNYISNDIGLWVELWKTAAAGQDFQLLKRSLKNAKKPKETTRNNIRGGAAKYHQDLLAMINNGWEPDSTQNMLSIIGQLHYVFDGITDLQELTTAIAATARTTKGFYEYSQHTHEIEKVARNWAKWIIDNPKYSPYGSRAEIEKSPKEPKVSRLEVVKQGLIDLLGKISDLTFSTTRELTDHLSKALKTSKETLYKFQELWQPLLKNCNAAPSNEYSDFELENNEACEKVETSESFTEGGVTVTSPNELLVTDSASQVLGILNLSADPAASTFLNEISKPLPDKELQSIMSFEQQLAIASTCKPEPIEINNQWHKPKEPPRENPSTLENIKAIVTADPSKVRSRLAILKAKLLMPWLKVLERSQTEQAIAWLEKFEHDYEYF